MRPKTMALAAFATSGLRPPPAPMPFIAPNMPVQTKAMHATIHAEKTVPLYHFTG